MTSPILHTDVYTDFKGLSELRARSKDDSHEALREVAGQFEALFIQMMLKSMRDANLGEGLMDSDHTKTYQSMFDQQIAIDLSKQQGLGLKEMLVRQLSRSIGTESGDATSAPPVSPASRVLTNSMEQIGSHGPVAEQPVSVERASDWKPDSPEAFVKELWPHAQRTARELGTEPELLLAQAALETGWGKHMIRGTDGRNSFNLFSIKADARWQGERSVTETVEFRDGLMRKERASFRAYSSLADSFADYAEFLKANPRYQEALEAGSDLPAFAHALSEAGYATDPEYSIKINKIINSERLKEAVSEFKVIHQEPMS